MEVIHRDPAEERPDLGDWDVLQSKDTLVIGCGNVLMGDDGLGPTFIKYALAGDLAPGKSLVSDCVAFVDVGTSIRTLLFTMVLSDRRPKKIIVVDAVDVGRNPGEVFVIELDQIPAVKSDDFSMHQLPTSNLLKELRDRCGVDVRVIAVQVESIPKEVQSGLSKPVLTALPKLQDLVYHAISEG